MFMLTTYMHVKLRRWSQIPNNTDSLLFTAFIVEGPHTQWGIAGVHGMPLVICIAKIDKKDMKHI